MADDTTTGLCAGGPLDGHRVTVRTPDGFLAADKANNAAWMYKRDGTVFRLCTDHDNSLIYRGGQPTGQRHLDLDRLWEAGETSKLDIIAI